MLKIPKILTLVKNKTILATVLTACLLVSTNVTAEERQGLLLNAILTVEHDDNVLRKVNATADNAIKLAPELQYLTHLGKHLFAINYDGEYTLYTDNNELNYNAHDIAFLAKLDHSYRLNSEYKINYQDAIEKPESNTSSSILFNGFTKYNIKLAQAKFYYGTEKSTGQVVFGFKHSEQRFNNHLQAYRDVDGNSATATFFYKISPNIRLLFETDFIDSSYKKTIVINNQSHTQKNYSIGSTWDVDEQLTGTVKIGYLNKKYDNDVYSNISGLSYLLDMYWNPNTYTQINVAMARQTQDSTQLGASGSVNSYYTLGISHELTARTSIESAYTLNNDEISGINNRTDKRNDFFIELNHSLRSWLDITLNYQFFNRKSESKLTEFDANIVGLSLTTRFD